MPNTTIKLSSPIEGAEGKINEIVLREPRYPDLMLLGEPAAYARSDSGMVYTADKDEVIHSYVERLLVAPADRALLSQVSLADALKLRDAVFDFFQTARKTTDAK